MKTQTIRYGENDGAEWHSGAFNIVLLEDYPALLKEATGGNGGYIKGVVKAT